MRMMRMERSEKSRRYTVILGLVFFCVAYIILAARPMGHELHFTPEWTLDIASSVSEPREDDTMIPFRLGQTMGYFTPDGRILSNIPFPFKASISGSLYARYGSGSSSAEFFNARGESQGVINEYGFPFFSDDRIYVFLPGGSSFVKCDSQGKREWLYESYAPVTAFSSSVGGTVAGFADGTLVAFTPDGKISQRFSPGGSDIEVILGADISGDGRMVACVSGRNRQRFVVSEKTATHPRVVFHEYVTEDLTEQVLVRFSKRGDTVYYNGSGYLGVVDLRKSVSSHVPVRGKIVQVEESSVDDMVFVLSRDGNEYTVTALEPFDHKAAEFSFRARSSFMQVRGDAVFLGRDSKISCLTVSLR